MKKLLILLAFLLISCTILAQTSGVFTDQRDGNEYKWVQIGEQIWMAEHLKYLPSVSASNIGSYTTPYYYVYGYEGTNVSEAKATNNYALFGVLYNWPAAMNGEASSNLNPSGVQGVCPDGWHLPSDNEFIELEKFLGMNESEAFSEFTRGSVENIGGKLKSTDSRFWDAPNEGATNENGFSAVGSGQRIHNHSEFNQLMWTCKLWTSSFAYGNYSWNRLLDTWKTGILRTTHWEISDGYSVRCIKDSGPSDDLDFTIELQPGYMLPFNLIGDDYDERVIESDNQFFCVISITSSASISDVELQATLKGQNLEFIFKSYSNGSNLDTNDDKKLDQIQANTPTKFYLYSDEYISNLTDDELSIEVISVDNKPFSHEYTDAISMYYIRNRDYRPYSVYKDAYQFSNPSGLLVNEFKQLFVEHSIDQRYVLMAMKLLYASGGRCFGMAASSGAYFLNPNLKPLTGFPFDWAAKESDIPAPVISDINNYHINQIGTQSPPMFDLEGLSPTIYSEIRKNYPVIIGVEGDDLKHAVLATKITKYGNEMLTAIQVYDSNDPTVQDWVIDDNNGEVIGVSEDWRFAHIDRSKFQPIDPYIFNYNLQSGISNLIVSKNQKVFAVACPVNMLVRNPNGERVGFTDEGIEINEIPNSEVLRVPASNSPKDFVTFITVPNSSSYKVQLFAYDNSDVRFEYYYPSNGVFELKYVDQFSMYDGSYASFIDDIYHEIIVDDDYDGNIDRRIPLDGGSTLEINNTTNGIQIYPNPFCNNLNIIIEKDQVYTIDVASISGKIVFNEVLSSKINSVDLSHLSEGVYIITIRSENTITTKKIIKH